MTDRQKHEGKNEEKHEKATMKYVYDDVTSPIHNGYHDSRIAA